MAFYDILSLKIMTFMTFYTDFETLMMANYMFGSHFKLCSVAPAHYKKYTTDKSCFNKYMNEK